MSDPVKKPRGAKAAKVVQKVEVMRFSLTEGEAKRLYKVMDQGFSLTASFKQEKLLKSFVELRTETRLKDSFEYVVDTTKITAPSVVVKDFPPPAEKKAPTPRKPKAAADLPKIAAKPKA